MMKRLQMKFKCEDGKNYNLSVQNPKNGLDAKTVKEAFQAIVDQKLIMNKDGGAVNAMEGAKIVTTSVETLF
ncbi:DUF2922 domain-containing protein [Fenollaria massiliensis]|uniref:DUF2922 domain-containing protein n=1 Tax=Fenollaria massiliensis TaxID=938288 RepID=A0A9E7DJF2_9FIRM|nr:DUF2922 domain-containing protein [Fenollaria massiliensis]UQK59070.1 DUF2922 domain-containing protein [Fenollaria massiliensis]